jgi:hypothetical protein
LDLAWVKHEEEQLATEKIAVQILVAETAQQYTDAVAHLQRVEMEQELLKLRGDEIIRRTGMFTSSKLSRYSQV